MELRGTLMILSSIIEYCECFDNKNILITWFLSN